MTATAAEGLRHKVTLVGVTDEAAVERCFEEHAVDPDAISRRDTEWFATVDTQDEAEALADCLSGLSVMLTLSFEPAP